MIDVNAKELLQKATIIGITPQDPNVNRTILGYLDLEKKEVVCFDKIQLATILMLARIGNDYINGPRRRIELYDHPGKAVADWRKARENELCKGCANYLNCDNMLHNGDKCFAAWCEIRVDPYTEMQRKAKERMADLRRKEEEAKRTDWCNKYPGLEYSERERYLDDNESLWCIPLGVRILNRLHEKLTIGKFIVAGDHLFKGIPGIGKQSYEEIMRARKSLVAWREDAKKGTK